VPRDTLLRLALPPSPACVGAARHEREGALAPLRADGVLSPRAVDTAALLVSALVTDAVRHARAGAGAPVELRAALTGSVRLRGG
jgi:hypothetical protein